MYAPDNPCRVRGSGVYWVSGEGKSVKIRFPLTLFDEASWRIKKLLLLLVMVVVVMVVVVVVVSEERLVASDSLKRDYQVGFGVYVCVCVCVCFHYL